jgi:hypothetical protein
MLLYWFIGIRFIDNTNILWRFSTMVITSWNDKNMDWNNPNPYKLEYITALY